MRSILLYALLTTVLFVVHQLLVPYLVIIHIVPDVLLVLVVYIAIREGQFWATIGGFLIGLLLDLTGGDEAVVGLSALSKSLAGFLAGYFYREGRQEQILGSRRFVLAVGMSAILHNVVYFAIYLQGGGISVGEAMILHAVPGTMYTAFVALLPMFFFMRRHSS